jgi:YegS/Rv2252/BmrU family lipid kinase
MPLSAPSTVVIANPAAAGGRVGRAWDELTAQVRAALGPETRLLRTEGPLHAASLAREAVVGGAETVCSMGGDGTHSEVVNGIMSAAPPPGAVQLGVLPAGTGGDFRRILQSGETFDSALRSLRSATARPIDVGAVSWRADDGSEGQGWFLNVASFGIGGLVDRLVNASSKRLPGGVAFYTATLRALWRYRPAMVRLTLDGRTLDPVPVTNVLVCNSRFAGGGMLFAPEAALDDGLFDVVIMRHKSALHTVSLSGAIYKGAHLSDASVELHRAAEVRAETVTEDPAWMDIDGEAPGTLPARLVVCPGAIRLLDARPDVFAATLRRS